MPPALLEAARYAASADSDQPMREQLARIGDSETRIEYLRAVIGVAAAESGITLRELIGEDKTVRAPQNQAN